MAKLDPVKDPTFQRTLRYLLTAPPKTQAEMKVGKQAKKASGDASKPKRPKRGV